MSCTATLIYYCYYYYYKYIHYLSFKTSFANSRWAGVKVCLDKSGTLRT